MNSSLITFNKITEILTPPEGYRKPEDTPEPAPITKEDLYNKDEPYYRKKPLNQIFIMKKNTKK